MRSHQYAIEQRMLRSRGRQYLWSRERLAYTSMRCGHCNTEMTVFAYKKCARCARCNTQVHVPAWWFMQEVQLYQVPPPVTIRRKGEVSLERLLRG